ncbi:hypothetical protein DE146DRAFT_334475 [Phaeosphaeria sp. MPI-PUGE-AT-0046c]|nr:hypothetical protein DE146DRAFT_334475 [Phaeosphaeria sp. MPI-PUGE-AT-0046c]
MWVRRIVGRRSAPVCPGHLLTTTTMSTKTISKWIRWLTDGMFPSETESAHDNVPILSSRATDSQTDRPCGVCPWLLEHTIFARWPRSGVVLRPVQHKGKTHLDSDFLGEVNPRVPKRRRLCAICFQICLVVPNRGLQIRGRMAFISRTSTSTNGDHSDYSLTSGVPAAVRQSRDVVTPAALSCLDWLRLTCTYPCLHMHVIGYPREPSSSSLFVSTRDSCLTERNAAILYFSVQMRKECVLLRVTLSLR